MRNHAVDNAYARCKACDKRFYPRWIDETKPCGTRINQFEELCNKCLDIATKTARCDKLLFTDDDWISGDDPDNDKAFIEGFVMDKQGVQGHSLYDEDEYLGGGFGDPGLFDNYE